MKAIILFIFFTILTVPAIFAQIKIGDNPQNINPASVLELESTSKVLVITRVSTLEMEAITPQRGGMVYNTDTECINYYNGTQWVNLCDAVDFNITNDPIINGRSTIEITESADGYNLEVAKNSILGDNIIDGGIGPDDIQDNSITQDKLASASVGSDEIRENAVGSVEIRDGSIVPANIENFIAGHVLTTDENGVVQWEDSDDLFDLTFNKLDTTLTISRSTIAGVSTISLGTLIGSDDQQLDLTDNILSLENDPNTVDLSTYLQKLSINPAGTEISLTNGGSVTLPQVNGSETQITEGDNVTITGNGTAASPYEISTADAIVPNGSETIVTEGNNITITGNGTTATPYIINSPDAIIPNGSETIVTEGNNITITGNGTTATPYIINAADAAVVDGTETVLQNGNNITIIGDGSSGDPYVINASNAIADNVTITGTGTTADPFTLEPGANGQFLYTDAGAVTWALPPTGTGTTNITEGTNITITGDGSTGTPYVINATGTAGSAWTDITGIPVDFADDIDNNTEYTAGTGLTLTANEFALDATTIVADWTNLTNIPANLDLDETDDFDGEWTSLANIPADIVNGDDDTQYTAGTGLTLTANEFALDATTIVADWTNLTNIPANLDLDETDDFDGEWTSLANIPTDIADGDDDTQYTAGAGLTLTGTEFTLNAGTLPNISNSNLTQTADRIYDLDENNLTFDITNSILSFTGTNSNVGIGNITPQDRLDVDGQIRARNGFASTKGSATNPGYGFYTNGDTNMGMYRIAADQLGFSTSGLEAMRINATGDVGIGIAPTSKLHVDGDILATGSITPDYVFQTYFNGKSELKPEYKMATLSEIEKFTKLNKHLPGVPSANEITKQGGILVNRSTEINLEKIEELFLHTIEQEKKIKELQSANTNMSTELEALKAQMAEIKTMLLEKQNN